MKFRVTQNGAFPFSVVVSENEDGDIVADLSDFLTDDREVGSTFTVEVVPDDTPLTEE